MATLLGTPYERGKSDVIVSRLVASPIEEGLFVADKSKTEVEAMASGKVPAGVMGQNEVVGCSVVKSGLRVYVQADDNCVPTVGAQVYVIPSSGKATHTDNSSANIGVNAVFAEDALKSDGVSENTATKSTTKKCVAIDFVGGL